MAFLQGLVGRLQGLHAEAGTRGQCSRTGGRDATGLLSPGGSLLRLPSTVFLVWVISSIQCMGGHFTDAVKAVNSQKRLVLRLKEKE